MNSLYAYMKRTKSGCFPKKKIFVFVNYFICERNSATKMPCYSFLAASRIFFLSLLSALTLFFYALSKELVNILYSLGRAWWSHYIEWLNRFFGKNGDIVFWTYVHPDKNTVQVHCLSPKSIYTGFVIFKSWFRHIWTSRTIISS